ncbi:hypothetical protein ACWGH4_34485, partial [Streptomyces sp. NPDC054847]
MRLAARIGHVNAGNDPVSHAEYLAMRLKSAVHKPHSQRREAVNCRQAVAWATRPLGTRGHRTLD